MKYWVVVMHVIVGIGELSVEGCLSGKRRLYTVQCNLSLDLLLTWNS